MRKTLIFCFDGTCSDPEDVEDHAKGKSITNIGKLHALFGGNFRDESKKQADNCTTLTVDGSHQRSFYYKTAGIYSGLLKKLINMLFVFESGDIEKILDAAVKDLKDHHQIGSHVLVFGFSRGAALARKFASCAKEKSEIKSLRIDFLGVFDTVASISGTNFSPDTMPVSDVVFENDTMSPDVLKAVHLVALDENRVTFQPMFFDYDPDRITEVWFAGVHADVGGGYLQNGLSDLALEYMIKKVEQECTGYLRILKPEDVDCDQLADKKPGNNKDDTQVTKDDISIKASAMGILHEHKGKKTGMTVGIATGIATGITVGLVANIDAVLAGAMTAAIIVSIISGIEAAERAGIFAGIKAGMKTGIIAGVVVGTVAGIVLGIINGTIVDMRATMAAGILAGLTAGIITSVKVGIKNGLIAGIIALIVVGMAVGIIAYITDGIIVGHILTVIFTVIVTAIVSILLGRIADIKIPVPGLRPREVRIAGKHPEQTHPMIHESVQRRYEEVTGYQPYALTDTKYVVTTDGGQVGKVRQGVPELGVEQKSEVNDPV